jgi:hypothetical protein
MCFGISVYAVTWGNWMEDPDFQASNEMINKEIREFSAPPFCVFPKITTSFCFQFYFLQIVSTMKPNSNSSNSEAKTLSSGIPNLNTARNMGIATYLIIGMIYLVIYGISWLASFDTNQTVGGYETKFQVTRDIIMTVYGTNIEMSKSKPILVVGQLGMIVLLICHVPFIYFIGKEHILSCVDEIMNKSLSQMVDRIKNKFKGDHRHFLVEKKFIIRDKLSDSVGLEEDFHFEK